MNNFRFPAILFIVGTLVVVLGAFLKIVGNGGVLSQSLLIVGMTATCRIGRNVFLQPHKETSIKTRPNEYKTCSIVT